jgi:hypothetical protein
MKISSGEFITQTEDFTGHFFNNKSDVRDLMELSFKCGKEKDFDELIFTAKYVRGLIRAIKKAPGIPGAENVDQLKQDISENIKKISTQLRAILSTADVKTKSFFEEKYLALNEKCINNLNLLLEDLEALKKYSNYLKRSV